MAVDFVTKTKNDEDNYEKHSRQESAAFDVESVADINTAASSTDMLVDVKTDELGLNQRYIYSTSLILVEAKIYMAQRF
jgi:hypothetical protein